MVAVIFLAVSTAKATCATDGASFEAHLSFFLASARSESGSKTQGREEDAAATHFRLGQRAIESGNAELAVREFQNALRLDPTLLEAGINLGLAYHLLGEYELSANELAKYLRLRPQILGANVVLGVDYLRLGLPHKAASQFKRALAIDPSNRQAVRGLADCLLAEGDYRGVVVEYRKLWNLESDKEQAWFNLGHDYLNIEEHLTTRVAYERPRTAWARRLAGDFLVERNLWNDAAREYRRALALDATQPGLNASMGMALLEAGKTAEAENEFRGELRLDPDCIPALLGLAEVQLLGGHAPRALEDVCEAMRISPQYFSRRDNFSFLCLAPEASRTMATELENLPSQPARTFLLWVAYEGLGEIERAESLWNSCQSERAAGIGGSAQTQAVESVREACRRHDYSACINGLEGRKNLSWSEDVALGQSSFALGQFENAADAFGAAMAIDPENSQGAYWMIHTLIALSDVSFGHLITSFPDSWRVHQLKAEALRLRHDDSVAIEEYTTAIRLRPDDYELHRALGELYLRDKSYDKARPELESALALNPSDGRTLFLMGSWYVAEHLPEKAIGYLESALKHEPGLLEARAVLGQAYLRAHQPSLAAPQLERSVVLDRYGDLHYLLYQAYQALGKDELAKSALARSQVLRQKSAADDQAKLEGAAEK